jgi:hypothetical protein
MADGRQTDAEAPMKRLFCLLVLTSLAATATPAADPGAPGPPFRPPAMPTAAGAPVISEYTRDAGPDETFFLVGENLSADVVAWGSSATNPAGQEWKPKVQFLAGGYLAATLPEKSYDGVLLVWVKNAAGCSLPIVLNAPQAWWCGPDAASAGEEVRIFGQNLARRPDFARAMVSLRRPGGADVWAPVLSPGKYAVTFRVPAQTAPGEYEVRVHAGTGGEWGWSSPVKLRIVPAPDEAARPKIELKPAATGGEIQAAIEEMGRRSGRVVLPAGTFNFAGTLRIPAGVTLTGAGRNETVLQLVNDPTARFARLSGTAWGQAPGAIHTIGDTMEYVLDVPKAGDWTVWLRYGTEMSQWKLPGVSGHMTLTADGGQAVPLENLPNTGSFGVFRWSKSAALKLGAGRHTLVWKNVKGGGISLDAFVFALDPAFAPSDTPLPASGAGVVVLQGEDYVRMQAKDGTPPPGEHTAVWLAGDRAAIENLSVLGNPQAEIGIAVRAAEPNKWVSGCRVKNVRVADCEGKQAENCAIHLRYADHAIVEGNELWGRTPLFISGARQSRLKGNRLVSVTRYGGNAEAAILGRTETIEECIIEGNLVASPPGAESGGPMARRLIWLSTGHGSVTHNWLAGNGVEAPLGPGAATGAGQARFGGVAGTDQNVGEMILFEGNHRTAYFGPLAAGDERSVTLPQTVPPTPDDRLGSVKRDLLAHDAAGKETPFWPPDADDGSQEPPVGEYYVTVFAGRGQGQTRRVVKREGARLLLDRPWRVAPQAGSVVAVGTAFYQNHITGNYTPDGMTGIQLWISCIENIVAGNTIARQRKPGLFFYGNATTLASSMPRAWNRGVSPLFWNVAEGNRAEDCSAGALVTNGDAPNLPVEFPRALGNVLRHNSFIHSREAGVVITSRKGTPDAKDTSASIVGTIVEFNVVRDASTGYHAGANTDAFVLRRNHAYFWYPVSNSPNPPVAFQIDRPKATAALELNSVEGRGGDGSAQIIQLKGPEDAAPAPPPAKRAP